MTDEVARIGPYALVRKLGRGGMAETYLARKSGPGGFVQHCCLKRVLPEFADDANFRDQFLDEATIHGRLQHGNIVRVSDFGEHEGTYFLVMELVDGCDLAQLLEASGGDVGPLPVDLSVLIALDLCQALAYAHTLTDHDGPLELVHRDLTPSNVLLTRAGEVKLSDFGIARAAQRRHRTRTGYTKGKFCYMSPEQIEAASDIDGRSDLFALGCVLYEMLAGQRPFDAESGNDLAVLPKILGGSFERLELRAPDLPEGLVDCVHALLARDRDDRPRDAQALLEMLAPFAPPITARSRLGERIVEVVEARRASQGPDQAPTRAVALDAETRQAYLGEPTEPLPGLAPLDSEPDSTGERSGVLSRGAPSRTALLTLAGSLLLLGGVALAVVLRASPGPAASATANAAAEEAVIVAGDAHAVGAAASPPAPEVPPQAEGTAPLAAPPPQPPEAVAEVADPPAVAEGESAPAPEAAEVRIVVVPYGNIWVDGKRRGTTRAKLSLSPGRHRVGIGRGDTPSKYEDVVLAPGRRTLEYTLGGAFD